MKRLLSNQWVYMSLILSISMVLNSKAVAEVKTKVQGDFHMTLYQGAYDEITDFQLFTKLADKEVYFGVSCSNRTPFPLFQVLLFNESKWMDGSADLHVSYFLTTNSKRDPDLVLAPLKGSLSSVNNDDEKLNKIRLEIDTSRIKSMRAMQVVYAQFLEQLKSESKIDIQLTHRDLGEKWYQFSLGGLSQLLTPYESVCR